MKRRLFPFRSLPASWGLRGEAFDIAEAHYELEGEKLARRLAEIRLGGDPKAMAHQAIALDLRYGHIDNFTADLKRAAIEIDDPIALEVKQIDIKLKYNKLTPLEAARQTASILTPEGIDRDIALLEINHKFNLISRNEFEKIRATMRNEPWVAIVNSGFDPEQGIDGVFFEFDWNEQWIDYLKLNGYIGHTPEQIVDDWFTEVCRSHIATENGHYQD